MQMLEVDMEKMLRYESAIRTANAKVPALQKDDVVQKVELIARTYLVMNQEVS
jgi:hypothetical protein